MTPIEKAKDFIENHIRYHETVNGKYLGLYMDEATHDHLVALARHAVALAEAHVPHIEWNEYMPLGPCICGYHIAKRAFHATCESLPVETEGGGEGV